MSGASSGARIAVVIVTYGKRWQLVAQVLTAIRAESALARVILVDNGATPPVAQSIADHGSDAPLPALDVVDLGQNTGSANGFARGIEAATRVEGITHVLLLDDDNVPEPGCFDALITVAQLAGNDGKTVVSALRRGRRDYERLLRGELARQISPNSFLGFHLAELPAKIVRRLRPALAARSSRPSRICQLDVAPYGGLFIPVELARRVPPPRAELLLYNDDHEYTARLVKAGAKLLLTDFATVRDVDVSWNNTARHAWVSDQTPAWRAYYACRNRVYVERNFIDSPWMYRANRAVYLTLLRCIALQRKRSYAGVRKAMRPVVDALNDARQDVTGERVPYQLPQPGRQTQTL